MLARILLTLILLDFGTAYAGEVLVTVTPVEKFTTLHNKNIYEGDVVRFKVLESTKTLKKDDIIISTILTYEPNGFFSQPANVVLGNFRTQNGTAIKGKLYLGGSEHRNLEEYTKNGSAPGIIRGGEIRLIPNSTTLSFFTEEQ